MMDHLLTFIATFGVVASSPNSCIHIVASNHRFQLSQDLFVL